MMNGYYCKEMKEAFTEDELLGIGYAYTVIAMLGIPLNIFTIYCYKKTRSVRRGASSNQLLLSLNVYDTLNCVIIIPYSSVMHLVLSKNCVALISYINLNGYSFGYCSYLITLIALQRYLKVTSVASSNPFSSAVASKWLSIINLTGLAIITFLALVIGPLSAAFNRIALPIVFLVTSIALPVIYLLLYRAMKMSQQRVKSSAQSQRSTLINNKVTVNVLILIVCHYLCCVHLFISIMLLVLGQISPDEALLQSRIGLIFFSFNSCINPFIYVFRDSSYKKVLKSIYHNLKLKLKK